MRTVYNIGNRHYPTIFVQLFMYKAICEMHTNNKIWSKRFAACVLIFLLPMARLDADQCIFCLYFAPECCIPLSYADNIPLQTVHFFFFRPPLFPSASAPCLTVRQHPSTPSRIFPNSPKPGAPLSLFCHAYNVFLLCIPLPFSPICAR